METVAFCFNQHFTQHPSFFVCKCRSFNTGRKPSYFTQKLYITGFSLTCVKKNSVKTIYQCAQLLLVNSREYSDLLLTSCTEETKKDQIRVVKAAKCVTGALAHLQFSL